MLKTYREMCDIAEKIGIVKEQNRILGKLLKSNMSLEMWKLMEEIIKTDNNKTNGTINKI